MHIVYNIMNSTLCDIPFNLVHIAHIIYKVCFQCTHCLQCLLPVHILSTMYSPSAHVVYNVCSQQYTQCLKIFYTLICVTYIAYTVYSHHLQNVFPVHRLPSKC